MIHVCSALMADLSAINYGPPLLYSEPLEIKTDSIPLPSGTITWQLVTYSIHRASTFPLNFFSPPLDFSTLFSRFSSDSSHSDCIPPQLHCASLCSPYEDNSSGQRLISPSDPNPRRFSRSSSDLSEIS